MRETPPRVIVLARPGDACERLQNGVRDAGAELLGTFDPLATTVDAVAGLGAEAVVVALEPVLEDALDGFQLLLADPAITVVFEEAELAAQRSGWDAARWVRHLAAKLHRHDDVLPPGAGQDTTLTLDDTPVAFDAGYRDVSSSDLDLVADEMRAHAGDVPREELASLDADLLELGEIVLDADGSGVAADVLDEVALGGLTMEDVVLETANEDARAPDGGFGELILEGASTDDLVLDADGGFDGARSGHGAERTYLEPVDLTWDAEPAAADDDVTPVAHPSPAAMPGTAGLSLVEAETVAATPTTAPVADALVDLDSRIGGLSLADVDSYGFGELQGAVLVEGGLGGPDPVRQLLSALPEDFPRALLVRLRLDGGRYDRLVRQMARATALPVALAEEGAAVERGTVYFLPPALAVVAERGRLRFIAGDGDAMRLPDALPANDSAVVFLSGADAALVDDAMGGGWAGALVVAQSLDGCYDGAASARVAEQGGALAAPAGLAKLLVERWAPGAAASGIELEASDE